MKKPKTEQIKADYRGGLIDFVKAMLRLRDAGHTPAQSQNIVRALIKEKYNHEPKDE